MNGLEWVVAVATGGVALFVAAELIARAVLRGRREYFVLKPNTTMVLEVDRETLPTLEAEVRSRVNRDGERGDDPPADGSDTYRILVAGGSAAECYYLDQPSTWPHVIQEQLNAPEARRSLGKGRVHVGNIGRSLVACDYIDLILSKVLPRYGRLDMVVLMVGASDMVAWLEQKTPPAVDRGELSVDYAFVEHPENFAWAFRRLALRRVASRVHKRLTRPVSRRSRAGRVMAKTRAMRAAAQVMLDQVPDPGPMLEHFESTYRRLLETARAKADRVLVVRQPWFESEFTPEELLRFWNFGAGRPYAEEVTTYYTHRVVNELMAKVDGSAARIADELGVEQLDLMPHLERSFETYYDYMHFTPKGAREVGRLAAAAILAGAGGNRADTVERPPTDPPDDPPAGTEGS